MLQNFLLTLFALSLPIIATAGNCTVSGKIVDSSTAEPLSYVNVTIPTLNLWTMTDETGCFTFTNLQAGEVELIFSIIGYASLKKNLNIDREQDLGIIKLSRAGLELPNVEVTAQRNLRSGASSYIMDRSVLDHSQVLNLSDIMSLLPGNQTVNSTLMNDGRLSLRSGTLESGNVGFGTAVEVDGVRIDNNANMDETQSASTRALSSSNVERVEVVAGVPGVEYGDVSNGVVKVTPRRGASPWIVELSMNPYTRQVAVNKGLNLGINAGIVNLSVERARSFGDIASPYTSYNRNILSASYNNNLSVSSSTLRLNASITGTLAGYNSKADPDAFRDTYQKARDNQLRANVQIDWLLNGSSGVWNTTFQASAIYSDKLIETNTNNSSSSTQAYLHTTTEGYAIATPYQDGEAVGQIVLGPTGYWYVKSFNDQKPLSLQLKAKTAWTKEAGSIINTLTIGAQFNLSANRGQGVYYDDMTVAPTWRPYNYSKLPRLNTLAIYAEEKITYENFTITAGMRSDITSVRNSSYGTVQTLSPRFNLYYNIYKNIAGSLNLLGGVGKGVKLPSFQVLYPAPTYSDKLVFTPGSTADNKAYYAYYTHVGKIESNRNLKWQSSIQSDLGFDWKFQRLKLSISGYYNKTFNPYQLTNHYTPFSYNYTSQQALENCPILSADRQYTIDPTTGVVTVTSLNTGQSIELPYSSRHTYIVNRRYINGTPVSRYGVEWIADFALMENNPLFGLSLRLDGNYYHYKGLNKTLIAGTPNGVGDYNASSGISPLIGYYRGCNVTSASSTSTPTVATGSQSKGCSVNTTLTARLPKVRMIVTLRLESTFLNYRRNLTDKKNAVLLEAAGDVFGSNYDGTTDRYVALYPDYFSTWEKPDELIPFADALVSARDNDTNLYRQLCNLIVRSNTAYYFNPQSISPYFSANVSVTKEIGQWVSISFYANNFFNNMSFVRNTQTGLQSSLFSSGYIPKFYYGLSIRLKI